MSNAVAANVLVKQQLPNNNINCNQTNDHHHVTPNAKYFKSSHLPSAKRTNLDFCDKFAENKSGALNSKRVDCMILTNLDSFTVGSQQQQQQPNQQATCLNQSSQQQPIPDQVYQSSRVISSYTSTNPAIRLPQDTLNTDHGDKKVICRGNKRQNDTNNDNSAPVVVEQVHCELVPQSSQQTVAKKAPGDQVAQGAQESDDSDEDSVFDYEIVLTKILNEKKLVSASFWTFKPEYFCYRQA